MKIFKRWNGKAKDDYDGELKMLKHISTFQNPHLTKLLTAFQHGSEFFLFFPLAEGDLWKCFQREPPRHKDHFVWMMGQLHGLASGLQAIHSGGQSPKPGEADKEAMLIYQPDEERVLGYHHT